MRLVNACAVVTSVALKRNKVAKEGEKRGIYKSLKLPDSWHLLYLQL
jgi:hypothetical protein